MRANWYFPFLIEVVLDADTLEAPPDAEVVHLRVPEDYVTPNGTLFKARAIHYACEHSIVRSDTWLVNLEEETGPAPRGFKGKTKIITRNWPAVSAGMFHLLVDPLRYLVERIRGDEN